MPVVKPSLDHEHGRVVVGSGAGAKAHILHCNYYNNYLLRTIWKDAGRIIESEPLLIGASAEQAFVQLGSLFAERGIAAIAARKTFAERFYAWQGFGTIDLDAMTPRGGVAGSRSQHYAEGWRAQFGRADDPVGLMTRGWLAGATAAIFDLPQDHFSTRQRECGAVTGDRRSVFALRDDGADFAVFDGGGGVGTLRHLDDAVAAIASGIDADAISAAIGSLPLFGSVAIDGGLIRDFDVMLTWHPHRYYDRISFECLRETIRLHGDHGRELIEPLLEEAGHRCGFRFFGGIWRSPEWAALVEPMCRTREDWVAGLIAIVNCAGWGRVHCTALSSDEAVFVVENDYESVGYLTLYGRADFAPSYLLPGGFRGMMNLVYNGDIETKPVLTEALYEQLSRRPDAFETTVERCIAMGDPVSVYRVTRKRA